MNILYDPEVNIPSMPLLAKDFESDVDFCLRLSYDSNCVARKTQVYSRRMLVDLECLKIWFLPLI
jgi:hypothetical protein